MHSRFAFLAPGLLLLTSITALAQANRPAELQMVTKGVFAMDVGNSIDLTDRGILLNLRAVADKPGDVVKAISISINGGNYSPAVGSRFDLKKIRNTQEFIKDIDVCMLDVVEASWPKGGTASATFRLMCP